MRIPPDLVTEPSVSANPATKDKKDCLSQVATAFNKLSASVFNDSTAFHQSL